MQVGGRRVGAAARRRRRASAASPRKRAAALRGPLSPPVADAARQAARLPASCAVPQVPARFADASGLQAFDLDSFLSMAARNRKWQDPDTLANSSVEQLQVGEFCSSACAAALVCCTAVAGVAGKLGGEACRGLVGAGRGATTACPLARCASAASPSTRCLTRYLPPSPPLFHNHRLTATCCACSSACAARRR